MGAEARLYLRKIVHPQAHENYRVVLKLDEGEFEIGSIGIQHGGVELGNSFGDKAREEAEKAYRKTARFLSNAKIAKSVRVPVRRSARQPRRLGRDGCPSAALSRGEIRPR